MSLRACRVLTAVIVALAAPHLTYAQPTDDGDPRNDFDFLDGEWILKEKMVEGETTPGDGERFWFKKLPAPPVIEGGFEINRGTAEAPRLVPTKYYSGYDNTSSRWTFYFLSEMSAQAWPGTLEDGVWYFFQDFVIDGQPVRQRQWWEFVAKDTVRRHIEHPDADGVYRPIATFLLVRTAPGH